MNNTKKFDGLATEYQKGRPAYAKAIIKDLYEKYGFSDKSVIAEEYNCVFWIVDLSRDNC